MQGERRKVVQQQQPDFSPFPSREIVSRISAAVKEARPGGVRACTYDSTLLNEGGRSLRFVETSLSEILWQPPFPVGQREREREIYERQIGFYACPAAILPR